MPYQTVAKSDAHIIVATGNDGQYVKFVEADGCPELATDPRFVTNPLRVQNRSVLVPLLEELVKRRKRDEWIDKLEAVGVPCGPINDMGEVRKRRSSAPSNDMIPSSSDPQNSRPLSA